MARLTAALYVISMAAVVVGVDVLVFRNHFWERLAANVVHFARLLRRAGLRIGSRFMRQTKLRSVLACSASTHTTSTSP